MTSSLKISLWSKSYAQKLLLEAFCASLVPKNFSQGPLEPVQYPKTPAKISGAKSIPKISSQGHEGPVRYPKIPVRGL